MFDITACFYVKVSGVGVCAFKLAGKMCPQSTQKKSRRTSWACVVAIEFDYIYANLFNFFIPNLIKDSVLVANRILKLTGSDKHFCANCKVSENGYDLLIAILKCKTS